MSSVNYAVDDFYTLEGFKLAYDQGQDLLGAGSLGNFIFKIFYGPLGRMGTGLIITSLMLIFLALTANITPSKILKGIGYSAVKTKDTVVKTNQVVNTAVKTSISQLKTDFDDHNSEREKNKQHIIDLMNRDLFDLDVEKDSSQDEYTPDYSKPRVDEEEPVLPILTDSELIDVFEPQIEKAPEVIDVADNIKILDFQTMARARKTKTPAVDSVLTQPDEEVKEETVEFSRSDTSVSAQTKEKIDYKAIKKENSNITLEEKTAIENEIIEKVRLAFEHYELPNVEMLNEGKHQSGDKDRKDILIKARQLEDTLRNFKIDAKVVQVSKGPMITRFEIAPSPGVKVSKIVNLSDDIALNLAATSVRIVAPIPGKAAVGIEVPNKTTSVVTLRDVIESDPYENHKSELRFGLGKDISGVPIVADLAKMPHLLIAGATGSGKSVCVNTIISSILFNAKPDEVKFLMIDPKVVELNVYNGIPHLILPVVTDPKKASIALNWAVQEMTDRYKRFAETGVRDLTSYNKKYELTGEGEHMPRIVVIIDELADLMMVAPNQVEDAICRIAQMARAAGIHLIVATQRPSVDVITGVIKANIPSRIAFAVSSQIDSRTIIDMGGAEKLLGKGDMLYFPSGESKPRRVQGSFITEEEVESVVTYVKGQLEGEYEYDSAVLDEVKETMQQASDAEGIDDLLEDAIQFVIESEKASTSLLQRRFRIGYNRAARMVDELEIRGIVGPSRGSKPREVLMTMTEFEMTGE
ncbi:DNA translocase FtsK [Fusibacter sp. A1]|nr:DNA translocase FtsK [Fusibacter sp. A1]